MSVGMENLRIVSSTAWELHLSHPIIAVISWVAIHPHLPSLLHKINHQMLDSGVVTREGLL